MESIIISSNVTNISVKDGVMIATYNCVDLDLEVAKEIIRLRIEASKDQYYPLIADIRKIKSSSKEARDYIATQGTFKLTSTAILVNSLLTKTLANFYLSISKPAIPTKMFTTMEDAMVWSKQFIK